jgi:hypothetical protein
MIGVLIGVGCLVAGVAIVSWACVYNAQLVEADVDYARSLEAPEAWEQEPVALWPATPGWCEEHGDEMDLASVYPDHPVSHFQRRAQNLRMNSVAQTDPATRAGAERRLKGHSHVSQQDITAHLIRVFGFGNFDLDLVTLDCVFERERMQRQGQADSTGSTSATGP